MREKDEVGMCLMMKITALHWLLHTASVRNLGTVRLYPCHSSEVDVVPTYQLELNF